MVIFIMGLLGSMIGYSIEMVQQVAFESKVNEVVQAVEYVKHHAVMTGRQYNTFCFENRILIRRERDKPIYTIYLDKGMYIPQYITGRFLIFDGSAVVDQAGTIEMISKPLKKKARITVGVATSKVRVYYEEI